MLFSVVRPFRFFYFGGGGLCRKQPSSTGFVAQFIEHVGHFDILGAVLLALVTRHAIPQHPAAKGFCFKLQAHQVHDLLRGQVQIPLRVVTGRHHGADAGAGGALDAVPEGFRAVARS